MNWSKIKTLMIYFLIVMNLFMVAFIAISTQRESTVPGEVISASVEVLQKDGFECAEQTIPHTVYNLPVLDASFYSASELSDIFFDKQLAFRTEENSLVAREGLSTLTVSENFFTFESGFSADKKHSAGKIISALKKAGINMDNTVYDKKERCFYRMYNGVNLFNMYIKAELDPNGELCHVSALWPGKLTVFDDSTLSFVKSITNVKNAFPNGGKIERIEAGYSLTPLSSEKYLFTPSWRVKIGDELKIIE